MHIRTLFCFLLITTATGVTGLSCTTSSTETGTSRLPGDVHIEVIPPDYVIQGEPVEYTFVIKNQSQNPLLLLELLPANRDVSTVSTVSREIKPVQDGALHRWTMLAGGGFSENPRTNEFTYTPRSTPPPPGDRHLHTGLLLPGASTRIRLRMLFLTPGRFNQHFSLRYHHTTRGELTKRAYVPERPLTTETNSSVQFTNMASETLTLSDTPRQILIRPPYQIVVEQTLSRFVRVFEGSFPAGRAEQMLSSHRSSDQAADRFRFDPLNDRWLIQTEDKSVWAVEREDIQAIPVGLFEDITHLASSEGPITFFLGPRLDPDHEILDPLWNQTEQNERSQKFDRKTALDLLQSLRSNNVSIRWTRTPLTNQPAAVLSPPED